MTTPYASSLLVTISGLEFRCVSTLIEHRPAGLWRTGRPITGIVCPKYHPVFEASVITVRFPVLQVRQDVERCAQHYDIGEVIAETEYPERYNIAPFHHLVPLATTTYRAGRLQHESISKYFVTFFHVLFLVVADYQRLGLAFFSILLLWRLLRTHETRL